MTLNFIQGNRGDVLLEALLGLFSLLALRHDGGTKSGSQIVGKFVKLGVAINLNGLLGGIAYYVAVVAPSQVVFEFGLGPIIEGAV
jgi:hypothetical protein